MNRLTQLIAVSLLGLAIPFTAFGLSTDAGVRSDLAALQAGADAPFDLLPGVKPPECKLKERMDGEAVDAKPAACCWFHWGGRWWCVSC
jgi:hypothetical protein